MIIFKMILWIFFIVEIFNIIKGCSSWKNCYENKKAYLYTDFLIKDLFKLNLYDLIIIFLICKILYTILKIQIITTIVFLPFFIYKKNLSKKSYLYNIFIYTPYIRIKVIRIALNNKIEFITITKNIYMFIIWGFPKHILNYTYKSFKIIKSYRKDPRNINKNIIKEILIKIYEETWGHDLKLLEKIIKYK
jgi:hypothetical protein